MSGSYMIDCSDGLSFNWISKYSFIMFHLAECVQHFPGVPGLARVCPTQGIAVMPAGNRARYFDP